MSKIYLHPLPVRIWHWLNAFIVIMLFLTGLQLRVPSVNIFSDYRIVVLMHKYFGYAMTLSFFFWLVYYIFTGGLIKHYVIGIKDIKAMPGQALYYAYRIFKNEKNPFEPAFDNKFNPLQKLAYASVMFILTPIIIISGIMFSDIITFFSWIEAIGGIRVLDAIHVAIAYIFLFYLIIHLYMATIGKRFYSHIKAMFTGFED
ncbi:MAG TPA: cytochrome b/b6 domain-containing protein [Syntrophorhabdaceae bacterium]|nr:cytochrome b/b6 domain-containing protein [Syntrophorhabdaceae bacterium]